MWKIGPIKVVYFHFLILVDTLWFTFSSKVLKNSWTHICTLVFEVNQCPLRFCFNKQTRWKSDSAKSSKYTGWVKSSYFRPHNNLYTSWTTCGHVLSRRRITLHMNRPSLLALMAFQSFKSVSKYQSTVSVSPYSRYSL